MSAHGIGIWNFEFWWGPPPSLPQERTMAYTRAGANDVALQLVGRWSDPFEVELTSHWSDIATASAASATMITNLVGQGWWYVKYADLNYTGLFGVGYHVLNIVHGRLYTAGILIGPGYAYSNGGVLVSRFTLQPETI